MSDYVKGEKPRDLDAAKGGGVLGRVRDFIKDHPSVGLLGPENDQDYASKGAPAKRTGDKCLPAIKPRK
jgi:hypothetical protein